MGVLDGKVVILTGAARGLGKAMSRGLLAAGARVVGVDLPGDTELHGTAAELGAAFLPVEASVTDEQDCARVVRLAEEAFGGANALVNNAGIGMQVVNPNFASDPTPFWDLTSQQWRNCFEVNTTGQFLMARALAPSLVKRKWGRIINVSTSFPTMIMKGFSPYGPSKAAVEAASVVWARDLAGTGVTVNVLLPGGPANTRILTDNKTWPDRSRLVQPEQMVPPVVWLVSDAADGVTARRFNASLWDSSHPDLVAAMLASAPAAW